jgi:hypothetical protein
MLLASQRPTVILRVLLDADGQLLRQFQVSRVYAHKQSVRKKGLHITSNGRLRVNLQTRSHAGRTSDSADARPNTQLNAKPTNEKSWLTQIRSVKQAKERGSTVRRQGETWLKSAFAIGPMLRLRLSRSLSSTDKPPSSDFRSTCHRTASCQNHT